MTSRGIKLLKRVHEGINMTQDNGLEPAEKDSLREVGLISESSSSARQDNRLTNEAGENWQQDTKHNLSTEDKDYSFERAGR